MTWSAVSGKPLLTLSGHQDWSSPQLQLLLEFAELGMSENFFLMTMTTDDHRFNTNNTRLRMAAFSKDGGLAFSSGGVFPHFSLKRFVTVWSWR
jgi:hypothetical protein